MITAMAEGPEATGDHGVGEDEGDKNASELHIVGLEIEESGVVCEVLVGLQVPKRR